MGFVLFVGCHLLSRGSGGFEKNPDSSSASGSTGSLMSNSVAASLPFY